MRAVLKPGGLLVLVVPAGEKMYGTIDRALGHVRRYNRRSFSELLEAAGFDVVKCFSLNKVGVMGWWLNGKILKRRSLGRYQLKVFNTLVPVLKVVEPILPWCGLSLVAVARKSETGGQAAHPADEDVRPNRSGDARQ